MSIPRKTTLAEDLDAWEDNRLTGQQILNLVERISNATDRELAAVGPTRLRNALAIVEALTDGSVGPA